jgi:hypothetical protein
MAVHVQLFHSKEVAEFAVCHVTFISPTLLIDFIWAMSVHVQLFHSKDVAEFALGRVKFISPAD